MRIEGGCHCGAIRYVAEIDPRQVRICHCTDCQTFTGSAYRVSVPALREGFELRGIAPKTYVKIADSGARRVQAFCAECGTPIYSAAAEAPRVYMIRVGTARERNRLRPTVQQWCRSALEWAMDLRAIPRFTAQATDSRAGVARDSGETEQEAGR